jgi:hypothetical protein
MLPGCRFRCSTWCSLRFFVRVRVCVCVCVRVRLIGGLAIVLLSPRGCGWPNEQPVVTTETEGLFEGVSVAEAATAMSRQVRTLIVIDLLSASDSCRGVLRFRLPH